MIRNLKEFDKINGSSFFGDTILTSASDLCEKLGVDITCYGGDKTHFEFELETGDGIPFTIYDWKESDWVDEDTKLYFHIGARNAEESRKALRAVKEGLR